MPASTTVAAQSPTAGDSPSRPPSRAAASLSGPLRPASRASATSSALIRPPSRAFSASQEMLELENQSHRRAHTPLRLKQQKIFIGPSDGSALARPLSAGLFCAAQIANFDELDARNIWDVPETERTKLTQTDVQRIFKAKCVDQHCDVSFDRARRFHELLSKQCCGTSFVLRQCGLGYESLRAIVDVLRSDDHYTLLDLSGNSFGREGGSAVADLLRHNTTLVVLLAQSCQLGEGMIDIADALQTNNTLTALDFSGIPGIHRNSIWGSTAVALSVMIQTNSVIAHLNLAHCGLSQSAKKIVRACATHAALTYLNLAGNKIGNECCSAVAQLLQEGTCELLTLNLEENCIADAGCEAICSALGSGGQTASALQTLVLAKNSIGAKGCAALAAAIREHAKLSVLNLSFNPLCAMGVDEDGYRVADSIEGVGQLFTALELAPALLCFNICACGLQQLPPSVISGLRRAKTLERLNISENPFGDAGAKILAQGLQGNRSLRTLNFSHCKISNEGGRALAESVEAHRTLEHLRLLQGEMDVDASGFVDAVRHNRTLLSVDLPKEALEAVRATLQRNKAQQIRSAGPELAARSIALQQEEKMYVHTQEMIEEEIKRREKLTEGFKVTREKQKVASAQFKAELQDLHDQLEQQTHVYKTLDKQLSTREEELVACQRTCDQEQARLRKKTEHVASQRAEIMKQVDHLKGQLLQDQGGVGSSGGGGDESEAALRRELQIVQAEIAEHKRFLDRQQQLQQQHGGGAGPTTTLQQSKGGSAGGSGAEAKKKGKK